MRGASLWQLLELLLEKFLQPKEQLSTGEGISCTSRDRGGNRDSLTRDTLPNTSMCCCSPNTLPMGLEIRGRGRGKSVFLSQANMNRRPTLWVTRWFGSVR